MICSPWVCSPHLLGLVASSLSQLIVYSSPTLLLMLSLGSQITAPYPGMISYWVVVSLVGSWFLNLSPVHLSCHHRHHHPHPRRHRRFGLHIMVQVASRFGDREVWWRWARCLWLGPPLLNVCSGFRSLGSPVLFMGRSLFCWNFDWHFMSCCRYFHVKFRPQNFCWMDFYVCSQHVLSLSPWYCQRL